MYVQESQRALEHEWFTTETNFLPNTSQFFHVTDIISLAKVLIDWNVQNALKLLSAATNVIKNDCYLSWYENEIDSLVSNNTKEFVSINMGTSNSNCMKELKHAITVSIIRSSPLT